MIVDSSALLEQATDDIIRSAFDSSGQRCSALRLLCIQEEIYDDLLKMLNGSMCELKIGNPEDLDTDMGPIITKESFKKLSSHIESFIENGMTVHQSTDQKFQNHIPPTIIEIDKLSDLKDEQFGPILHILKFKSDKVDNLIKEVNDLSLIHI